MNPKQPTDDRQQATGNGAGSGNRQQPTDDGQQAIKGHDIACRLLRFAVGVLQLVRRLQRDTIGRHMARQLLRSATAGGANYEEARCAESRADFAHKVSIAAKELRESRYWLRLLRESKLAPGEIIDELTTEAGQLIAILTASAKTAKMHL
jgi:four helix bundle protein